MKYIWSCALGILSLLYLSSMASFLLKLFRLQGADNHNRNSVLPAMLAEDLTTFASRFYIKNKTTAMMAEEKKRNPALYRHPLVRSTETDKSRRINGSRKPDVFDFASYEDRFSLNFSVNGITALHQSASFTYNDLMAKAGVYGVAMHQVTGRVLRSAKFSNFRLLRTHEVLNFLLSVQDGRIIFLGYIFDALKGLSSEVKGYLRLQGSYLIEELGPGDRWTFLWTKGGRVWSESSVFNVRKSASQNSSPQSTQATVLRATPESTTCTQWPTTRHWNKRRLLCDKYEGYGNLCSCTNPRRIALELHKAVLWNRLYIPTVISASNRPLYLSRCLKHLSGIVGYDPQMTLVVADGDYAEVRTLAEVYGIKITSHTSLIKNVTKRITEHYKVVLERGFELFPKSEKILILEDDLQVALDFYGYFAQLAPLLDSDPTLYCVSAWNDLGYSDMVSDPRVVMRTDIMPGLGWILTRKIFEEMHQKWPTEKEYADWDMWMRLTSQQKGRDCLVPEVSRTYHFGRDGAHISSTTYDLLYTATVLNSEEVELKDLDRLVPEKYDKDISDMISTGVHMDGGAVDPCVENLSEFVPPKSGKVYVLWIKMESEDDDHTWRGVAYCLGLWALDLRGGRKFLWRLRPRGTALLMVGFPISPFSILKPKDVNVMERVNKQNASFSPGLHQAPSAVVTN